MTTAILNNEPLIRLGIFLGIFIVRSAGAIIIAGSGLPPRSARGRPGDDITGDKAVRELIARTKGHYY